jgi:hypothetical protein
MRKMPQVIAASLITAAAAAACTGHAQAGHGTVTGILVMLGGPPVPVRAGGRPDFAHRPDFKHPRPGHVIATSATGRRFTVSAGKTGRFTMLLPPGTYQLTGYPQQMRASRAEIGCTAVHAVHVRAGTSTRAIEVICPIA